MNQICLLIGKLDRIVVLTSLYVGDQWRALYRHLLTVTCTAAGCDVISVTRGCEQDVRECAYRCLQAWRKQGGSATTHAFLVRELTGMQLHRVLNAARVGKYHISHK